jgi:predicted naringenin-chalcone synthase
VTTKADGSSVVLSDFSVSRPRYRIDQSHSLAWLANVHATSEATARGWDPPTRDAFAERLRRAIERCACDPSKIGARGHVVPDGWEGHEGEAVIYDVTRRPRGADAAERTRVFDTIVSSYFEQAYAEGTPAPANIIHGTCPGYVAPNGAQKVVSLRGWGALTRVTNAYHMGCYAALPAVRMAAGFLALSEPSPSPGAGPRRVDIVHTELCSLHIDPSNHSVEQLVVQSLFADGFVRYAASATASPGLAVLAQNEVIVPDSAAAMTWTTSDAGMQMTLARDVPERIAASLREFLRDLYARAGLTWSAELARTVFAVHPGGPRIIESVRELLELTDAQVQTSRDVLFEHGNMSSATLPHVWARLVDDPRVARDTLIVSLAFGPGLTVCGAVFRKV